MNIESENIEEVVVEPEDNSSITTEDNFNPSDIKVRTQPYTIAQVIDNLKHGEINMNTDFQRLSNLWSDTKKSSFIESLLLNLPIPMFYFAEMAKRKWEVVDGLQRISTLKSFVIDETLKLTKLEFLTKFNDKTYSELKREIQRSITDFPITICIIEQGTPDFVKFNLFKRINQGGLVLEPQEIRHALNQGIAADVVADLVRAEDLIDPNGIILKSKTGEGIAFAKVTQWKIKSDRMQDRDFATRFISFYLIPYNKYEPDLDSFMNKGMGEIKKLSPDQIDKLKSDFKKSMELALEIFGEDAFRKRNDINDKRKPINKALFEVLSVNFAKLSDNERGLLNNKKHILKSKLMDLHNNSDQRFYRSISQGTAKKDKVEQRFSDIEKIIRETLN